MAVHTEFGQWEPGRWYRMFDANGNLWMETSDPEEIQREHEKTGWPILRQWIKTDKKWRKVTNEDPE